MSGAMYIDRFSAGLDDMKRKDQRDPVAVLKTLKRIKRFSVFEATENMTIAKTLQRLADQGYIKYTGGDYPWTTVELTKDGDDLIALG